MKVGVVISGQQPNRELIWSTQISISHVVKATRNVNTIYLNFFSVFVFFILLAQQSNLHIFKTVEEKLPATFHCKLKRMRSNESCPMLSFYREEIRNFLIPDFDKMKIQTRSNLRKERKKTSCSWNKKVSQLFFHWWREDPEYFLSWNLCVF